MVDFYKNHEKIEVPICYFIDNDGTRIYDYDSMAEEFENRLSKVTGVTVMCYIDYVIYEEEE